MGYQIIHSTRERLRVRVPRLAVDSQYTQNLRYLVESFEFTTMVRISQPTSSLILYYDRSTTIETVKENLWNAIQKASEVDLSVETLPSKPELRPGIELVERIGLPILSLTLAVLSSQFFLPIPGLIIIALIAAASISFLHRLLQTTLQEQRLNSEILEALWLCLYTIRGDYVGPALMLSLIEIGDALRDATARTSERQTMDLFLSINQYARIERDGQEQQIPLKDVHKGDRVIVYPGEAIPVAGRVLRGTALIDEHQLTGESSIVSRSEGQVVHAYTFVLEGKICILAKRIGKDTRVGIAVEMLKSAPVHDTRVQDYAAQVANGTIAPALLLSGIVFALTQDISRSLSLFHLDFSQAINITVPSTMIAALTYAAKRGIFIRSGRALEKLSQINVVVFDKTGTLTQGKAEVVSIITVNSEISETEVLQIAASAEEGNRHPAASAITRYALAQNIPRLPCEAWDYRIGFGVVAQIGGQRILVGSHRLIQEEGINTNTIQQCYPDIEISSNSTVYVARDHQLLGVILYTDPARPESAQVLAKLNSQNQEIYILTGDSQRVAAHVAQELGIPHSHVYAEAFPDRKVEVIQKLQTQGHTIAFVGEGINDAAALAYADVSISFATGSDIARETADVVIDDDLRSIPRAISIAKQAMNIIYQNTALIAIPTISVVLAGLFLPIDPILSVILSNGPALIAELNSFSPLFDTIEADDDSGTTLSQGDNHANIDF